MTLRQDDPNEAQRKNILNPGSDQFCKNSLLIYYNIAYGRASKTNSSISAIQISLFNV